MNILVQIKKLFLLKNIFKNLFKDQIVIKKEVYGPLVPKTRLEKRKKETQLCRNACTHDRSTHPLAQCQALL